MGGPRQLPTDLDTSLCGLGGRSMRHGPSPSCGFLDFTVRDYNTLTCLGVVEVMAFWSLRSAQSFDASRDILLSTTQKIVRQNGGMTI